jgi:hypothetical protein
MRILFDIAQINYRACFFRGSMHGNCETTLRSESGRPGKNRFQPSAISVQPARYLIEPERLTLEDRI